MNKIANSIPVKSLSPAAERGRFITPPAHLKGMLQPFNNGNSKHNGIKTAHVKVFEEVSKYMEVLILVRGTNPKSLEWMGEQGYCAKPLDCKPKTAKADGDASGSFVRCAGLVVCPELFNGKVFKDQKIDKVQEAWQSFKASLRIQNMGSGCQVYLRSERKGFYVVDTDPSSRHYGCLLVSDQLPPDDFDIRKSHSREWVKRNMNYIHGDYDLYGVIDQSDNARPALGNTTQMTVIKEQKLGMDHFVTDLSMKVAETLNDWLGLKLVMHGEETARDFTGGDDIYIFYPSGAKDVVLAENFKYTSEMANAFQEMYHYLFKADYSDRSRVVRQGSQESRIYPN